ncbi:hypothetical protein DRF68_02245 [Candidatus Chryseobacterium massiliae]|uniref:Uncharacterized protein n=1 Tax=Candidatus Chryseobacterium massiliense TaxID=204089 RepID=A0A3D9BGA4_9FLAO|nr:hypothetical protein DRF68_02245 [Candidatus Chryseobacterium massiliae]
MILGFAAAPPQIPKSRNELRQMLQSGLGFLSFHKHLPFQEIKNNKAQKNVQSCRNGLKTTIISSSKLKKFVTSPL